MPKGEFMKQLYLCVRCALTMNNHVFNYASVIYFDIYNNILKIQ